MTLQHSPGPWVFDEWDFAIYGEHATIATFASDDLPIPADGKLIAAAPDMLRLLRVVCDQRNTWEELIAAIDEGRGLIARLDGDT